MNNKTAEVVREGLLPKPVFIDQTHTSMDFITMASEEREYNQSSQTGKMNQNEMSKMRRILTRSKQFLTLLILILIILSSLLALFTEFEKRHKGFLHSQPIKELINHTFNFSNII